MLEKIDSFWKSRYDKEKNLIKLARYRDDGRLEYDIAFIKKYIQKSHSILDLGSGPAIIANKISPFCEKIICIEKQSCDWKNAIQGKNIQGIRHNAVHFLTHKTFDVILIFGVINCLTEEDVAILYANCRKMMHPSSYLILKSQFGLNADVYIDHFSEELQSKYQSHYRTVESEMALANDAFKYEIFDIYPSYLNPHKNTHHFHIVCTLKQT